MGDLFGGPAVGLESDPRARRGDRGERGDRLLCDRWRRAARDAGASVTRRRSFAPSEVSRGARNSSVAVVLELLRELPAGRPFSWQDVAALLCREFRIGGKDEGRRSAYRWLASLEAGRIVEPVAPNRWRLRWRLDAVRP
jgi:hypothetical protein